MWELAILNKFENKFFRRKYLWSRFWRKYLIRKNIEKFEGGGRGRGWGTKTASASEVEETKDVEVVIPWDLQKFAHFVATFFLLL